MEVVLDQIVLLCRPTKHAERFECLLGERVLSWSQTPFFSAARVLLAEGVDPSTRLVMRWVGKDFDALIDTVGSAAAFTIKEESVTGALYAAKFAPGPGGRVNSRPIGEASA